MGENSKCCGHGGCKPMATPYAYHGYNSQPCTPQSSATCAYHGYNYQTCPPTSSSSYAPNTNTIIPSFQQQQQQLLRQAKEEYERHAKKELLGQLGFATAGLLALRESREAKRGGEGECSRHKVGAEMAGAVAAGSAAYAFHENREKKKSQRQIRELGDSLVHRKSCFKWR